MSFDRDMMKALEADGEKLRQLTGEDHGPVFLSDEPDIDNDPKFEEWIRALQEDVVQAEYGYEPGEFDVFPELWHGLYAEGLTPSEAFKRALDDHAKNRS